MNIQKLICTFTLLFSVTGSAYAKNDVAPLALVYAGPGACSGCEVGAAKAARAAGFRTQYVTDQLQDFSILKKARIWVQPGGESLVAADRKSVV